MAWVKKLSSKTKRSIVPGTTAAFAELSSVFGVQQIFAFDTRGMLIYEFSQWGEPKEGVTLTVKEATDVLISGVQALMPEESTNSPQGDIVIRTEKRAIVGKILDETCALVVCSADAALTEVVASMLRGTYELSSMLKESTNNE